MGQRTQILVNIEVPKTFFKNNVKDFRIEYDRKHISEILSETGLDEGELFTILLRLEFKGYVRRTSFEYFVAVPSYIWYKSKKYGIWLKRSLSTPVS